MKKTLALLLTLLLCVGLFGACTAAPAGSDGTTTPETTAAPDSDKVDEVTLSTDPVRVFTLQGPTGMGMAKLMHDSSEGDAALNYQFTVASAPDEFTGDILQGNFEIAAVPTNLAAVLYAKTEGAVSVAAVNTMGVLHILENGDTVHSIEDLAGKTVYSSGQGQVPEYALNYILDAFGVECEVIYEGSHDEVATALLTGAATIAVLPEPKVTATLANAEKPEGLRVALDLTEAWNDACAKKGDDSALYMGCVIVNNAWAAEHSAEVAAFLSEYKASIGFISEDLTTAAEYMAAEGIIPAAKVAEKATPGANIVYVDGEEMAKGLAGFYQVLCSYNPAAVGGSVPDAGIYYSAK